MSHRLRNRLYWCGALVLLIAGNACSSPTSPAPLDVTVDAVRLSTIEELRAWPSAPTISGGQAIHIRGKASVGCGRLAASATRQGHTVVASISSDGADGYCLANKAGWQPFALAIEVPPGHYDVESTTVGYNGVARSAVTVGAPGAARPAM